FTTKDVGQGTGLGLDTARRIVVERHNGSIEVQSGPGSTTFHVWLPLQPSPATTQTGGSPAAPADQPAAAADQPVAAAAQPVAASDRPAAADERPAPERAQEPA